MEMIPADQTLFLINERIACMSHLKECQISLMFNFKIERGGELIDEIQDVKEIILVNRYLGKYIRVTCSTGITNPMYTFRDISVESIPYGLSITGVKRIITNNNMISCTSKGFPAPTIVWTEVEEESFLLIEDSTIIIRNWDRNGKYTYTCTAFNKHGEVSETISFYLYNINMKESHISRKFYIIIYIELVLYHIFLMVIVRMIFKEYLYVPVAGGPNTAKSNTKWCHVRDRWLRIFRV